ncbi:MAG: hypothetical protein U0132_23910 [Gemmatimonadaceae bacterium]
MPDSYDYYKFVPQASRLLHDWDPIGVYSVPDGPSDEEYDAYVPGVIGLLIRDADISEIASHLGRLRAEAMGLPSNEGADRESAAALHAAFRRFKGGVV